MLSWPNKSKHLQSKSARGGVIFLEREREMGRRERVGGEREKEGGRTKRGRERKEGGGKKERQKYKE